MPSLDSTAAPGPDPSKFHQLAVIQRSVRPELLEGDDHIWEVDHSIEVFRIQLRHNVSVYTVKDGIDALANLGLDDQGIVQAIDRVKLDAVPWFERKLHAAQYLPIICNQIWMLVGIGVRWPELAALIHRHKTTLLRNMLQIMARGDANDKISLGVDIEVAQDLGIHWPELTVIQRSLAADDLLYEATAQDLNTASEAQQLAAVQQDGYTIHYIKNPSPAVQLAAVQQNGYVIRVIKNPSPAVQLAAVQQNAYAIRFIRNPSPAVQLAAVQQDGRAIQHIDHPSAELWSNPQAKHSIMRVLLTYMKSHNDSDARRMYYRLRKQHCPWPELAVIGRSLDALEITESVQDLNTASEAQQIAAVRNMPWRFRQIQNPSEAVQIAAVETHDLLTKHIIDQGIVPSEAVQLAAVRRRGSEIIEILKAGIVPSEAVQLAAVQHLGYAIKYILRAGIVPSEAVQLAAVQQDGYAIRYINNPGPAVQLAAVQQDSYAIHFIKNPSAELWSNPQAKHSIMRALLTDMKSHNFSDARRMHEQLRKQHCPWPELAVIGRSLDAAQITEAVQDLNTASEAHQLAAELQETGMRDNYWDVPDQSQVNEHLAAMWDWLASDDADIALFDSLWILSEFHRLHPRNKIQIPDLGPKLAVYKRPIVSALLHEIKHEANYMDQDSMTQLIKYLQQLGADWPELDTILRSISVKSQQIREQTTGPWPEMERFLNYVHHQLPTYAVYELDEIARRWMALGGSATGDTGLPRIADHGSDWHTVKATVIRGLLMLLKANVFDCEHVARRVTQLLKQGWALPWPELDAMEKSMLAGVAKP